MEPELSCVSPATLRADGFGELQGGTLIVCSLLHARRLLNPKHPVLTFLGKQFPYEMAVGMNGRVWIKSSDVKHTLIAMRAIQLAASMPSDQVCKEIKRLLHDLANE